VELLTLLVVVAVLLTLVGYVKAAVAEAVRVERTFRQLLTNQVLEQQTLVEVAVEPTTQTATQLDSEALVVQA
jgi:hypothetical protein